jgi:lipid A 3-O-deacylase
MNTRISSIIMSASLLLFCTVSIAALADGMPYPEKKPPQPAETPLDKSLNDIQNKEPPVAITPAEPTPAPVAEAPAPVAVPPATDTATAPKEETPPVPEARIVEVQPNTSFFGLSVGMYDPFTHDQKASSFNAEWQPGVQIAGFLQPIFGAFVTTNGAMMGYGGLGVPFNITDHVFMMPSAAVGAYKEGGGYDLDSTLAFRVGTELAYQFDDKSRLGLNMHVISNGTSTNREDRTEIIGLAYTMPIDSVSKPAEATPEQAPETQAPPPPPATTAAPPAEAAPAAPAADTTAPAEPPVTP